VLGARFPGPSGATLVLGSCAGIDYVAGFLLLMAGIARGPLAIPVTVMRLSVVVPVIASIYLWREQPGLPQWIGIVLGLTAICLFGWSISAKHSRKKSGARYWVLILSLFAVMGIGDTLLKAFGEYAGETERLVFIFVLFTVAAVSTWVLVWVRRISFDRGTLLLGFVLGVPNLLSTVFMLKALGRLPASIAFPFVNLAVILGSMFLAFAIWGERISKLGLVGLTLAAVALIVLPMR
jgi:drug/metabolite transporter (DMT)-like permease